VSRAATQVAQDRRARARLQRMAFVKAFADAGGTLVLASGAGSDGYPAPGLAVHKEMALLLDAGLTPAQVWRAAVLNGAVLLGEPERRTHIRAGAAADFVVVTGDPLTDPAALSRITLIVRAGEILDRDQLIRQAARARGVVR
jgi:imidazolonepropionase-like amidohydrolase